MSWTPRTIDLSQAPGSRQTWGRPWRTVLFWMVCERLFIRSSQPSSRLRVAVLRAFGANLGQGILIRPGVRIKSPWKLSVGDRCWIGEEVWIHNQAEVSIGADVVLSQGTFLTTGSHAYREDMALVTRPVTIEDGAWVTSRCVVLAGTHLGRSAMVLPNTVIHGVIAPNAMVGTPTGTVIGTRFPQDDPRGAGTDPAPL